MNKKFVYQVGNNKKVTHFMFSKYRLQKFCTESFSKMYSQEETAEMHYSCAWCAFSV